MNSERLGERGDIGMLEPTCNKGVGNNGLEELPPHDDNLKQYVDTSGKHSVDIQINIEKFGKEIHNGILNTREMAHKWNWHSDSDEFNWRNKPCALRTWYNEKRNVFRIQIWNELVQIWIDLSLTKEEILRVLNNPTTVYEKIKEYKTKTIEPYCDSIISKELKNGIEWDYIKDNKSLGTAFLSYKDLYEMQVGKESSKCQFCEKTEGTRRYRPTYDDNSIFLCEQHEKYIQRISQRENGIVDEV